MVVIVAQDPPPEGGGAQSPVLLHANFRHAGFCTTRCSQVSSSSRLSSAAVFLFFVCRRITDVKWGPKMKTVYSVSQGETDPAAFSFTFHDFAMGSLELCLGVNI